MKRSKSFLLTVCMLVLVLTSNVIFAATASIIDTTKTGSLTIIAREQANGSTDTSVVVGLQGVEYTLYKVDEVDGTTVTTVAQAETAIASLTATAEATTNENGRAEFTGLALGRYYAKVTAYPTGTSEIPESFIVDIPMTNDAGDGWTYDITVQPKVKTASGGVTLSVKDDNGNVVPGAVVKVQVSTEDGVWTDYVPEGEDSVLTLTTDSNGEVSVDSLPITINEKDAKFRFYMTDAPEDTDSLYIINNSALDYVYVNSEGKTVVGHADGTEETASDAAVVNVTLGYAAITKGVKTDAGTYASAASVGVNEAVQYKIEVELPSKTSSLETLKIEDTLENGLTGLSIDSIKVVGVTLEGEEEIFTVGEIFPGAPSMINCMPSISGNTLTLTDFPVNDMGDLFDKLVVTYDAYLDMDTVTIGNAGATTAGNNENTAKLTITNNIQTKTTGTIQDSALVVTGGLKILKVNGSDEALAGATFKIAATEDDAKAGNFLTDTDGNEIVAVSGDDGYVTINGLAYNDAAATSTDATAQATKYYLVETQAPTYTEEVDGVEVTKSYKLLTKPVEVTVTGVSHDETIEIVNRKPFELPATGGIGIALFVVIGMGVMGYSIYTNKKSAKNVA